MKNNHALFTGLVHDVLFNNCFTIFNIAFKLSQSCPLCSSFFHIRFKSRVSFFNTSTNFNMVLSPSDHVLARLFRRQTQAIMIVRPSSLCKNVNVAHYSRNIKDINAKLEYLLIMTRCSCKTRGITLKVIVVELCPF